MEPINEPEGWRHLQDLAQREQDPRALAAIIDKMNRLLDQHDWSAAAEPQLPNRYAGALNCAVGLEISSENTADRE